MITSLTIGGLTIGTVDSGYFLKSLEGFDFSEIDVNIKKRGFYDGASLSSFFVGKKVFRIEGQINGVTTTGFETKRRALEAALNIKVGLQTMTFTTRAGLTLQSDVILTTPLEMPYTAGDTTHCPFRIEVAAPYPFILGQTLQTQDISVAIGGGFAVPFEVPLSLANGGTGIETLNNAGNSNAYPLIKIYGALTNPGIKNQTTGEGFSVVASLGSSSDILTIDPYYRTVTLNGITNYRANFSGDWVTLAPGDNEIRLSAATSSGLAKAVFEWRDHYQGI
jgi:hypothetical protein